MPSLKLQTAASAAARAVLPRFITPAEFAAQSFVTGLWAADAASITITSDAVSAVANLKAGGDPLVQDSGARRPTLANDAILGRNTMVFASDGTSFLTGPTQDYDGPITAFAVFRAATNAGVVAQSIVGAFDAASESSAGFYAMLQDSGNVTMIAAQNTTPVLSRASAGDVWQVAIITNDGSAGASYRLNGQPFLQRAITGAVTETAFRLSHSVSTAGLRGRIDMAGTLNVDVADGAQASALSLLRDMLRLRYGAAITV